MKKIFTFILMIISGILYGQNTANLIPEKTYADPDINWEPHGTAFYNYLGEIFVANYTPVKVQTFPSMFAGYPNFYTYPATTASQTMTPYNFGVKKSNVVAFGFLAEDGSEHEAKMMGQNFFFEYNKKLWYYQTAHSNLYNGNKLKDEGYKCFAEIPSDQTKEASHFYILCNPAPWYVPMGAFQFDSLLYFLSIDQHSGSPTYGKWYLEEFEYKSSNNTFYQTKWMQMSNIPGDRLGGVVARKGTAGPMLIVSTYSSTAFTSFLGKITVSKVNNAFAFTYTAFNVTTMSGIASAALVPGSIKGNRTPGVAPDQYPANSERIVQYGVNKSTNSDGQFHLPYYEYYVLNDNIQVVNKGEMTLPSGMFPHKEESEFDLRGTVGMILASFNDYLPGYDGYQQWSWCFYPLKNGKIGGAALSSDTWQMVPGSLISSTDISHDMDTAYGKSIRSLWTLVGIIDGAPPAVINWDVWDPIHTFEYKPSDVTFVATQVSDTSTAVTGKFGATFTHGEDISREREHLEMEFGCKTTYSGGFEKKVDISTSWKQEFTQLFELDKETQEYGTFIWSIPQIDRVSYQVYPWWDSNRKYPLYNQLQYLFRIAGMSLLTESIKLDEAPFSIQHPTENNLAYWKQDYRWDLYSSTKLNNISSINISWRDNNHGNSNLLRKGKDSTSTYNWNIGYAKEITAGVKIPKVFSFNISVGSDIDYSAETKVRTYFGNSIEASYKNMWHKSEGIDMNYVATSVYVLKPEQNVPYWYFNYLDGQRPWYVAYLVTDCYDNILPSTPEEGACLESLTTDFSWNTSLGELHDFKFYISESPDVNPATILFSKETGDNMSVSMKGFQPEKGKTYYWSVRGMSKKGELLWSEPRTFRYNCEPETIMTDKPITTSVSPNPGNFAEIKISVDVPAKNPVPTTLQIMDLSGNCITREQIVNSGASLLKETFPGLQLSPGIYLAVFKNGTRKTVNKLLVQ